jgi:hypothetical protein
MVEFELLQVQRHFHGGMFQVGVVSSFSIVDLGLIERQMDPWDIQEIHLALRSHEEKVHYNHSSIYNMASKLHALE